MLSKQTKNDKHCLFLWYNDTITNAALNPHRTVLRQKQVNMNEGHSENEEAKSQANVKATTSRNIEESRHIIQVAKQRIIESRRRIASTQRRATRDQVIQERPALPT